MRGKINTINNAKYAKDGWQLLRNRKTIWSMLKDAWKGNYKMSFITIILLFMGLLYVVIPIDFDWIPLIGWIDDGFVILLMIKRLQKETLRYNRHKAMERKRPTAIPYNK